MCAFVIASAMPVSAGCRDATYCFVAGSGVALPSCARAGAARRPPAELPEPHLLHTDERRADVELDQLVRLEHDLARVAVDDLAVNQSRHLAVHRADLPRRQLLPPDVEELAEVEGDLLRRLHVDDPVAG